jgi:tetratricopeptide (TPR) repeat protein
VLLPLLLAGVSFAADLEQGWYLADSGRGEEGVRVAAEVLADDPDDLDAHRLYIWSLVRTVRDGPPIEAQYRAWVDAEPDNPTARVALATLLSWRHDDKGPWCQEVASLVEPLPADDHARFLALRARYEAGRYCEFDQVKDRQVIIALSAATAQARGYGLQLRFLNEPVDDKLVADLAAFYGERPRELYYAAALWGIEPEGPQLDQARTDAVEAARKALGSDDPIQVHAALRVFKAADDMTGVAAAAKRCQELDPGWAGPRQVASIQAQWALRKTQPWSPLMTKIDRARRKAIAGVAVRELEAMNDRVPESGLTRAYYLEALGMAYERAGKDKKALRAYYDGWQAEPANGSMANTYAYTAALQQRDLGKALEAINTALIEVTAYDPQSDPSIDGYDAWMDKMAHLTAARLDTRAWILHLLGHDEEAAADLRRALLVARETEPIFHLHLGLVYAELGLEGPALEHLGRGLAMGPSDEHELELQAREVAEELFATQRWAPGGLDAWLAARLPDSFHGAEALPPEHLNVGMTFPDLTMQVDGEEHTLSDFGGVRVIDIWASTCDACLDTLDPLNALADAYQGRGVQVFLLSVDDKPWMVKSFWQDAPPRKFEIAWAGRDALGEIEVPGMSTVFIIDGDGTILACLPRFRGVEDSRLARKLEEALIAQEQAPAE